MTSERMPTSSTRAAAAARRWVPTAVGIAVVIGALGLIAYHARMGAVSPRIANPAVTGVPRPVEFRWGNDFPVQQMQWGTLGMMVILVAVCARAWIRRPGHPNVLMVLAATGIVWQDPIMNWAPYAVYNPQLWHWPEDWPLVNLSPTVEPFVVIGYATFYFVVPFFVSSWILRGLQTRASADSFVWRHPLLSLALLLYVVGFGFDALLEIFSIRAGLYIYSQVMPWGSVAAGTTFQFPLIWESTLVTVVMIPAGVLCHRDDTGRTQAEKLVQKLRWLPRHPALGTFLMMFAILNVAYFCYGAGFAAIRASKLATAVACPWPFPEAKVYDPNGFYEKEGHPGPFFEGHWNGWMSGQPAGRPELESPAEGGRCGPGRV